jgi:carboxymethylenebutenolidase
MLNSHLQSEFDGLLPGRSGEAGGNRRSLLKSALGVGYAAATMPIVAQDAIRTSSEGLRSGETMYEVSGFKVPAFYAAPMGRKNLPVILLVHEVFGVHEYIADTARRFARAGYLAIAPDLFARQGDAGDYSELAKLLSEVVAKVPDAQVMADLDGAVRWAGGNGGNLNKIGITGFCWGGRITWLYAEQSKNVKAGVAWYGRLSGTPTPLSPANPIDLAAGLKAPVLGLYGGQDRGRRKFGCQGL